MKDLFRKMFNGWKIHEASWTGEGYARDETDCMIEACNGNKIEGQMLSLFDHWSNDIQALAAHYGITVERNEKDELVIREDIPSAPSPDHWWNNGVWKAPEVDETLEAKS